MSESSEHIWLKQTFLSIINDFSNSKIFSFEEANRGEYDFSATLFSDRAYILIGQVLWKNSSGITKDLQTLILNDSADLLIYIYPDKKEVELEIKKNLEIYQKSKYINNIFKLRLIKIPAWFSTDNNDSVSYIKDYLCFKVLDDIVFNVLLNQLNFSDIRYFLHGPGGGFIDSSLHCLVFIAENGFTTMTELARALRIGVTTLKPIFEHLCGTGFIYRKQNNVVLNNHPLGRYGIYGFISSKGIIFLKLIEHIYISYQNKYFTKELLEILNFLKLKPSQRNYYNVFGFNNPNPEEYFKQLIWVISEAKEKGTKIEFSQLKILIDPSPSEDDFRRDI